MVIKSTVQSFKGFQECILDEGGGGRPPIIWDGRAQWGGRKCPFLNFNTSSAPPPIFWGPQSVARATIFQMAGLYRVYFGELVLKIQKYKFYPTAQLQMEKLIAAIKY